jgi:tRNA G18 (ribose-2'-O)-methylase SpoU
MNQRRRHGIPGRSKAAPASQDRRPLATPVSIADPDDPRLEPFRHVRERDLVGRQGRFVAEGEVVLRELLAADRFVTEAVLVSRRVAEAGRPWFALIPPNAAFLSAADPVVEAVVGFAVHRGILAIGRPRDAPDMAGLLAGLPARALAVACVGLANHDNLGGIFRSAAAFGVGAVLCDASCCDPLYRKAIRVSVGGVFRVPFARGGAASAIIAALEGAGFDCLGLSPGGAAAVHEVPIAPRTALVIGAEGPGLPAEILGRLRGVRIAMAPGFDSLNAAVSAGIAMHQAFNRR